MYVGKFYPQATGEFSGPKGTHIHPGEQILQVAHICRDLLSGRKFREQRKFLNLCAHTEICLIDGGGFLQSLENLSPR